MKDDLEGFQLAIVVKEDFEIRFHLVYHLENYDLLCFLYFQGQNLSGQSMRVELNGNQIRRSRFVNVPQIQGQI